ncbi:hypothetical protein BTJ40_05015 [Microbulbifer sp. A4B17]|uniref:WapI family immunity protein n=1 Tax=Microbulbifer sp. A4B17 TaxID=359370 RepID=UPI000D52AD79|nr:hypothetical protein [Microbulbifer sp. A4B17]AWF80220.1 hypothetical protein BTJ40_05015 [Microbulbifer sp. A4B17]
MFKLSNVENKVELELSVEGYQFPESPKDDWCFIKLIVKQGKDTFEAVDPALETTELMRILEWFRHLSERRLPRYTRLSFTEPCLEFKFLACTDSSVRISIHLSHELKPNFELKQFGRPPSDWRVVFELKEKEFNKVISGVESALLRCPVRDQS